ncbi:NADH dehydrogenase (ubiquinone) Fe-S protein 6 [Cryptococcus neoformans C23]|uniref:NADH dehydrogenase (Ubiquinone) Fe-S protein 6 n=2 Tax=Cryptococcus neoformans TaxID=5207 RepID=A0A854Q556_CRYNE|nr:NADH dehydrogenase (ubiquinone) Fe-S protein 6 [Cryptococcus neoformans var. grubii AD2-60a]OWZ29070.1 NADH dehydrogenase (ubiquinone) Fe-S protein 6 [Cryptococcus neoformans var. grubii AD1-83a]OWZ39134.1 NADH dehydrogenase (ubiquinone) Fe-S protein 6 [Cryptococcus neoformans var. grubii C23]OXC81535.1 NADH dehydrogenase (ubiquinone) Fe-S protein 6 [Cryptococcus neoformans var. grubii AD1-7a]OXG11437.1 NADH dehydrogenase (ubiquinone) Fe-S protein 6 [Cryptococcus neoformans var. grubii Tu259
METTKSGEDRRLGVERGTYASDACIRIEKSDEMVNGTAVNGLRRLVALCHTCDFALKSPNTIFVALHSSFVIHLISSRQLYTMSLLRSARVLRLSRPVSLVKGYATPPTPSTAPLPEEQPDASSPAYLQQSPNVPTTWSTSQNPKPHAYDNGRFEQTAWEYQPNRPSAMGMVAEYPVRLVQGRKAACDGGGGALGHPKIFINLDKPGPKVCGYCGIRFEQAHDAHH